MRWSTNLLLGAQPVQQTALLPSAHGGMQEAVGRHEYDHTTRNEACEVKQYLTKFCQLGPSQLQTL